MMNEMKTGVYTHGEESYTFKFYTDLTVSKKMKFVNSVVSLVVDDKHYNSVIRDLLFDFYVVDILTDIDTTNLKDSSNFLDDVENFLLETNIVEIVKANAFPVLFDELNRAVDDAVEYLTGIHKNPLNYALSSLMSAIEKKMDEVDLSDMISMAQKFAEMTKELTTDNIINAYMNSDIHKKNLDDIKKDKHGDAMMNKSLDHAVEK